MLYLVKIDDSNMKLAEELFEAGRVQVQFKGHDDALVWTADKSALNTDDFEIGNVCALAQGGLDEIWKRMRKRAKEKDGLYETADKWMERTRREVVEDMIGKKS